MGPSRRAREPGWRRSLTTADAGLDAARRRWIEATTGGTVVGARRGYAGGSRELWFVDVADGATVEPLVLRVEAGGAFTGTELSLEREATVYRALRGSSVPVPGLVALADGGHAALLERVAGTSSFRDVDATTGRALLRSFVDALAQLHLLDPSRLELPGFHRPRRAPEHALGDLTMWERIASAHLARRDPMIDYARSWLRAHAPDRVQRTVLVQGDTGPGNFLHEGGRVTGLVDWEFSHVGDPMDDVAWIDMRARDVPGFADVGVRDRLYEEATGLEVDADAVRYYTVFVRLRCAVTTGITISRGGGALGLGAYFAPHHRFLVQLGHALADAIGFEPSFVPLPDARLEDEIGVHDHAIAGLRDEVVPTLEDPATKLAVRAALLVLEHDRAEASIGAQLAADDEADRRRTFGAALSGTELADVAVDAGTRADRTVLDQLIRSAQRAAACWETPAVGGRRQPAPPARPR